MGSDQSAGEFAEQPSGRSAPLRPPPLAVGDRAVVVAPASPFEREKFERGVRALQELGLEPAYTDGLFARYPQGDAAYLAGDDQHRLHELRTALQDPVARLLILARGGYGLMRLALPSPTLTGVPLGPAEVAAARRLLLGYSDATVLHELWRRAGVPSIHGPMCTQLGEEQAALGRLRALLTGEAASPLLWEPLPVPGARAGEAEGILRGGNLAMLAALCGTRLQPRFEGCLVLLEDLNEPPYRLDRLVTQLLTSGAFDGARGFLVGDLWGPAEPPRGRAEALAERLSPLGVPLVFGAPFGHAGRNQPVAFGCAHALDAGAARLTPLEKPTA